MIYKCSLIAFRIFFGGENLRVRQIANTLERLKDIESWFQSQEDLCFYSSSILLLHSAGELIDEESAADVRLVDFAHVYPANGLKDDNFIHGLQTLIKYLEVLIQS